MKKYKIVERICKCGCNISFKCQSNNSKKFIKNHSQRSGYFLKGKTYEEIYGVEGSRIKKEKQRISMIGKKFNRIKPCYRKGLTYEQAYGIEKAIIIKNKIKEKNKSRKWTTTQAINKYLSIPKIRKCEWNNYRKKKILPDRNTINRLFGSLDEFIEKVGKPFLSNERHFKFLGKNEKKILDKIELEKNIKLERQFSIKNKFFIDGYDPINNVAYEVDEVHHKYQKIEDLLREEKIKVELNCKFIRINEKDFF